MSDNQGIRKRSFACDHMVDKIMTGESIHQQDLVISKLLRQNVNRVQGFISSCPCAIQLTMNTEVCIQYEGDTIRYIYRDSLHKNPLCRVILCQAQ